ncbi:hypothetical protein [Emticicia sp. TH156]|uniref:hypothetical protein n=1 Tax=Emticicia sp. TH156 TaxID=2067454 RepID=UPI000C75B3C3|nr:hypothetical protein [Emticicia sp. TH156]PLK44123.1 hypothetical protein C0V77_13350 [Emticicia sp. TH156]
MKKILILTLLLLGFRGSFAQRIRVIENFSVTYGFEKSTYVPSIMYGQSLVFGKKYAFAAGTGIRLTSFFTAGNAYKGLESSNTRVSFTPYPRANANALNVPLMLEFRTPKIVIGANFDIVGLAFGKRKDSLTVYNKSGLVLDTLNAKPTRYNLGLGQRGTTNNEIYIGFRPQEELTIKVGLSMIFSQYDARYRRNRKDVPFGRFGYESPLLPFISVVFNFER